MIDLRTIGAAFRAGRAGQDRWRIDPLPAASWTGALMLAICVAASLGATWLRAQLGLPIGMWLAAIGAAIAAYLTRRPAGVEPKSSAPSAPRPRSLAPSAPSEPSPAVGPRSLAPSAPPSEPPRPERAILDFNPPGPAPRERVPRQRPKRTKAPAAAVPIGAERSARADADPPVRKPRRRKTEPGVNRPEPPTGSGESARARPAGRT